MCVTAIGHHHSHTEMPLRCGYDFAALLLAAVAGVVFVPFSM